LIFEYRTLPSKQIDLTYLTLDYIKQDLVNCFNLITNAFTELVTKVITLLKLSKLCNLQKLKNYLINNLRNKPSIIELPRKYFMHNINKCSIRKNLFKNFNELKQLNNNYVELGIQFKLGNVKRPRNFRSFLITVFTSINKFGIEIIINLRKNDKIKIFKIINKVLKIITQLITTFSTNTILKIINYLSV